MANKAINNTWEGVKAIKNCSMLFILFFMSIAWLNTANAQERLSVQPDRTIIAENETFTVLVKYEDGDAHASPNFSPLETDFDILGNTQSSQYRNINGRVTSFVQWTLTLAPKQAGKVLIPPLTLGKAQSKPVAITVNKVQAQAKGTKAVFLETHIETREAYVQEEFVVTLKLFFKENIIDVDAEQFVIKGASLEELPRAQYQTTIGNSTYEVLEMRFSVTANTSGTLDVPSFLWSLRSSTAPANRFGTPGRTTLHRLRTEAFTVNVKPRPNNFPANQPWLPAKSLTISEKWSEANPRFIVGEPVTRTITIAARGLTGEQLPPITSSITSDDFKFYPDQPKINSNTDDRGKLGERIESMAVIPTRAGTLTLPAVEIAWWDTKTDSLQIASLPAKTINVQAAAAKPEQSLSAVLPDTQLQTTQTTSNGDTQTPNQNQPNYWPWICAALVLLNIVQMAVFGLMLKRGNNKTQPIKTLDVQAPSLKQAINAANNNNASGCHNALNLWLRSINKGQKIAAATTLEQYFRQTGASKTLINELIQLDIALYKNVQSPWQGQALAKALAGFSPANTHHKTHNDLPTLYPA